MYHHYAIVAELAQQHRQDLLREARRATGPRGGPVGHRAARPALPRDHFPVPAAARDGGVMVAAVPDRADTGRVSRRVTSPVLIGRSAEVEAATTAIVSARAGRARFVLVSGDAGIGKTRLVSEVCGRARQAGMLTAVGGCVQTGDAAVAYAPLAEVLRDLLRQLRSATLTELMGPGAAEIRPLLGGEVADGASRGGSALFEHLLGLLVRLGEHRPALVVFEDLHWADPSTRDLVAFLARNLREAAVAIVLTYRSDELHRRHPLHGLLADVRRDPDLEAIALPGLGRADLSALVGEISDEALPAARVDELAARSGGNPFYVEELIAAGPSAGLPASLAEAILAPGEPACRADSRRAARGRRPGG